MSKIWPPYENVLWHVQQKAVPPCTQDMHVEVAIVGGGMAGLSAAQAFAKKGKKVALFEQYFCGSGGTGESSGFITSNAEISLTDFAKRFSPDVARQIWSVINGGIASIANNIEQYSFDCELTKSDALYAALSAADFRSMQVEHENLEKLGFKSLLYDQSSLRALVASEKLYGGVVYENSFGINAYAYCQELKRQLQSQGVQIFEETPVTKVDGHTLSTAHAKITADYIVICVDRFLPDLGFLVDDVYHVQNFVMASQQLTAEQIDLIFPAKKQFMIWDSQLLYNYFRLTPQGRMILGGSDLWTTYVNKPTCSYSSITRKLNDYFSATFPQVKIQFEYQWSGLIGISKDIAPLVGPDKKFEHIFYVAACAGLPIAAAFGAYSAEHLLEGRRDMDPYFSPYRSFKVQGLLQKILGKKLSFAICNALQQNIP